MKKKTTTVDIAELYAASVVSAQEALAAVMVLPFVNTHDRIAFTMIFIRGAVTCMRKPFDSDIRACLLEGHDKKTQAGITKFFRAMFRMRQLREQLDGRYGLL